MIDKIDNQWYKGNYLFFKDEGRAAKGAKTQRYAVTSKFSSALLGYVKWYVPWRQYTFFTMVGTILDKTCMRELAEFCEQQTNAHRQAVRERKK